MIDLSELQGRISQISKEEWKPLFDIIPEIEKVDNWDMAEGENLSGGDTEASDSLSRDIVMRFLNIVDSLDIVPAFNWLNWKEGRDILEDNESNYSQLDIETLCKLLAVILRADRFSEGYLVDCFEDGIILNILKGLKMQVLELGMSRAK